MARSLVSNWDCVGGMGHALMRDGGRTLYDLEKYVGHFAWGRELPGSFCHFDDQAVECPYNCLPIVTKQAPK